MLLAMNRRPRHAQSSLAIAFALGLRSRAGGTPRNSRRPKSIVGSARRPCPTRSQGTLPAAQQVEAFMPKAVSVGVDVPASLTMCSGCLSNR
jgi:hypothetical protein